MTQNEHNEQRYLENFTNSKTKQAIKSSNLFEI